MLYLLSAASRSSSSTVFVISLCTILCLFLVPIRETNNASEAPDERKRFQWWALEGKFQSINNRITISKLLKLFTKLTDVNCFFDSDARLSAQAIKTLVCMYMNFVGKLQSVSRISLDKHFPNPIFRKIKLNENAVQCLNKLVKQTSTPHTSSFISHKRSSYKEFTQASLCQLYFHYNSLLMEHKCGKFIKVFFSLPSLRRPASQWYQ